MPKPLPMRQSVSRRVSGGGDRWGRFIVLSDQLMNMNSFELKSVFRYRPHTVTGSSFFASSFFCAPGTTPAIIPSADPSVALSSASASSLLPILSAPLASPAALLTSAALPAPPALSTPRALSTPPALPAPPAFLSSYSFIGSFDKYWTEIGRAHV